MSSVATVHGRALDPLGLARRSTGRGGAVRGWACAPEQLRSRQPKDIPLNVGHGPRQIGRVVALERDVAGLWVTATLDRVPPELVTGDWFYSLETDALQRRGSVDHEDVVVTGVAVTRSPAQTGLDPVRLFVGDLASRGGWTLGAPTRDRLDRAYGHWRLRAGSTMIIDPLPKTTRGPDGTLWVGDQPASELCIRPSTILSVGGRPVRR
jgi:hypothetical protein